MTGGFAQDGRDSYKQNQRLIHKRKKLKDNPYSPFRKFKRAGKSNYNELLRWKINKSRREKLMRITISLSLAGLVLFLILWILYN